MINKSLVIISLVLVLIIIVEFVYIVFNKTSPQKANEVDEATQQQVVSPSVAAQSNPAFSQKTLGSLRFFGKSTVVSGIATVTQEGKIVEIDKKEGYTINTRIKYEKAIKLENNGGVNYVLVSDNNYSKVKVFNKVKSEENEINFDTLNIGDRIEVVMEIDLVKDPLSSVDLIEIIKY